MLVSLRRQGNDMTQVEVKLATGGFPALGPTLSAFGNMPGGGTIILGLDEADGFAAVGVTNPGAVAQNVATQARALRPPVRTWFETAIVDGATIVLVTVYALPRRDRPCYYQGQAYLRQSDGNYPMSDQEIRQVLAQGDRPRFDEALVPGSSSADLDHGLAAAFVRTAKSSSARLSTQPDDEVLIRKGVMRADGVLTVAGLYALGAYPQQYLPSLSITAAVELDRRSGARTRDLVHLDGPLPELLESAMDWVRRNTITTVRYRRDGHGEDVAEIPMVAVRELIANALVHRDLGPHTQGKRVEIRLRDDTLVISNPGGLFGISAAQLGTPQGKSAVNEFLYDMCRLIQTSTGLRVIEGEGGGIREVRAALRQGNMAPAQFIDKGVNFTVLVPRHSLIGSDDLVWLREQDPRGELSSAQRQIAVSMRHGATWTNALVRNEFAPMDSLDARAELRGLVNLGLARAVGARGSRTYRIEPRFLLREDEPKVTLIVASSEPELLPSPAVDGEPAAAGADEVPDAVLGVIQSRPLTLAEIAVRTGLSRNQARYRLNRLRELGLVRVNGGWGVAGTTYEATASGDPPG